MRQRPPTAGAYGTGVGPRAGSGAGGRPTADHARCDAPGADAGDRSKTIDAIRPAIQADGGDIFLRGVDEDTGVVTVELVGACVSCPASTVTLKAGIERILKGPGARASPRSSTWATGPETDSL